ncbi:hypothetical protein OIU77_020866 [Salix suchowensis]|uniref:Uncharacterized protein n=1 Tax=Salix suchowensis TaxID=1278906 RepID=A0ABQ9CBP5_9ROSI|nr:hypothetical protein OIU77_020866 [Salix suchowensis]
MGCVLSHRFVCIRSSSGGGVPKSFLQGWIKSKTFYLGRCSSINEFDLKNESQNAIVVVTSQ